MAISSDERRFLRSWEEQREGGKAGYVATYTFGLTFVIFLSSIAVGLFANLPFVKLYVLVIISIVSLVGAFIISIVMWNTKQKRFRDIINRELTESGKSDKMDN
ncbi:MAG: hypothetical protein V4717_12410 [Bacteroidota bacterium]